jgi:hypothetical protein
MDYLEGLASEYEDYFGRVGVNAELQRVNEAAAACWNWATLANALPGVPEVHAFDRLFTLLSPVLQKENCQTPAHSHTRMAHGLPDTKQANST